MKMHYDFKCKLWGKFLPVFLAALRPFTHRHTFQSNLGLPSLSRDNSQTWKGRGHPHGEVKGVQPGDRSTKASL